jgi:hypothetical protein
MNNGIFIRLSEWHTVDLEEKIDLGEGSIIMQVVSFCLKLL